MKKYILAFLTIFLFLPFQIWAQTLNQPPNDDADYPHVPRVSAYEAYVKYKAGKAIIFHAGGNAFSSRHILGAFNLDLKPRDKILAKFPKQGIEIFTYCYWGAETGGAGLADEMIKMGFKNVKNVKGGGKALEKYFEYYTSGAVTKVTNPRTGKVIVLKKNK